MVRVGIIEDNKFMREGWKTFIDYEKDLCVVATFSSCEDAFESNEIKTIDLLIMDIGLPGMSGIEGVAYVRRHHPEISVIMATVFDDDENIFEALKAGAIGYLTKKVTPDELIAAIRDAMAGGSPITPNIARKVINVFRHAREMEDDLSERELQILQQLATGKSYAAIGKDIYLSVDGVRHHIRKIYQKLEVHSRSEAIAKGISRNIINPDA